VGTPHQVADQHSFKRVGVALSAQRERRLMVAVGPLVPRSLAGFRQQRDRPAIDVREP
jgi:hypothetical protein